MGASPNIAAVLRATTTSDRRVPIQEPWSQTVTRTVPPEGLIVEISYAPSLHE